MLAGWATNALPGFRELRPTFASGVLWSVFLVVAGHETIANAEGADGLAGDIHTIARQSDPLLIAVVLGTLVFALGAVTFSAVEWLARRLGSATDSLARVRAWKIHSELVISQLKKQISTIQSDLAKHDGSSPTDPAARKKAVSQRAALINAERRLDRVQYHFGFGPKSWLPDWLTQPFLWRVRQSESNITTIGDVPPQPGSGLEVLILVEAAIEAAEEILLEVAPRTSADDISELRSLDMDWAILRASERLAAEVRSDPANLLRVYSQDAYLQYDKEVVESKLRVAVAAPTISLGVALAFDWPWASILVLLGAFLFVASSLQFGGETKSLLDAVRFRRLPTPAVVTARRRGRDLTYEYLRSELANTAASPPDAP